MLKVENLCQYSFFSKEPQNCAKPRVNIQNAEGFFYKETPLNPLLEGCTRPASNFLISDITFTA
jgi:hypothetical protein